MKKVGFLVLKILLCFASSLLILFIGLVIWYYVQWNSRFPNFRPNDFFFNANTEYLDYVRQYDFAVAYHSLHVDEGGSSAYKILGCKDGYNWELMTIDYSLMFDVGERSVRIKQLTFTRAGLLLDSLKNFGFFDLSEEKKLVERCSEYPSNKIVHAMHTRHVDFEIIQGIKMRKLHYDRYEVCPDVEEWANIEKLISFFERM